MWYDCASTHVWMKANSSYGYRKKDQMFLLLQFDQEV